MISRGGTSFTLSIDAFKGWTPFYSICWWYPGVEPPLLYQLPLLGAGTSFNLSIDAFNMSWHLGLKLHYKNSLKSGYPIVKWGVLPWGQFLWFPRYWLILIKINSCLGNLYQRTAQIPLRSKTGDITYEWPLAAVHSNAHDWWHEKHSLMETLVHLRKMNRTLCILLTVLWLKPWESRLSSSTRRHNHSTLHRHGGSGCAIYISFLAHGPSIILILHHKTSFLLNLISCT